LNKIRERKLPQLVLQMYKRIRGQACEPFNNVPHFNDFDEMKLFFAGFGTQYADFLVVVEHFSEIWPKK
jgi:hypothetical protein